MTNGQRSRHASRWLLEGSVDGAGAGDNSSRATCLTVLAASALKVHDLLVHMKVKKQNHKNYIKILISQIYHWLKVPGSINTCRCTQNENPAKYSSFTKCTH